MVSQELQLQRDANQEELRQLRQDMTLSEERRLELAEEISTLDKDRVSINRSMIEASKKSRGLEKRIGKSERRLAELRNEQAEVRGFLKTKQALLAEILAALQRMGRKPPPALLVTPEDALSSVRSAILLGSVVPEVRSETEILLAQINDLNRIGQEITSQREALMADLSELASEEERLNLLLDEKQKLAGIAQGQLAEEQARAAELAARATSLNELIVSLENQIASAKAAAEAARLAEAERIKREENRKQAAVRYQEEEVFSDAGRTAPAIGFAETKGLLPLPVSGNLYSNYGDRDEFGDPMTGISLQTRENTRVISPTDGWILYAGPFRTYGKLLIIDAGSDYHVVLAGLENVSVSPGQFVIVGEPLGQMGARQFASAGAVDVSTTKPILYVEFRKDGTPIDPTPWWSDPEIQKVADGS